MLQCIFLLSDSGEVILEKQLTGHWVDRSICAWFWDQAISQGDSFKLVPIIASPTHYLFQVVRDGILMGIELVGEEELQWNSYSILDEQLNQEWLDFEEC